MPSPQFLALSFSGSFPSAAGQIGSGWSPCASQTLLRLSRGGWGGSTQWCLHWLNAKVGWKTVRSFAHLCILLLTDICVCAPQYDSLFYMKTVTPAQLGLGIQSVMGKSDYSQHLCIWWYCKTRIHWCIGCFENKSSPTCRKKQKWIQKVLPDCCVYVRILLCEKRKMYASVSHCLLYLYLQMNTFIFEQTIFPTVSQRKALTGMARISTGCGLSLWNQLYLNLLFQWWPPGGSWKLHLRMYIALGGLRAGTVVIPISVLYWGEGHRYVLYNFWIFSVFVVFHNYTYFLKAGIY